MYKHLRLVVQRSTIIFNIRENWLINKLKEKNIMSVLLVEFFQYIF